ncbi:MAG TPA: glycosyltransferase family 9 protein [Thermoanaerobaculia bacterium]|nr:glycosyltransferase family 9 protein [Thermoanaerobaculia bacterium]
MAPALPAASRPPRSIFVLRNNDIGDLLAITPLFEALRRHFPETLTAAGVGSWNLPVLQHNPYISEVLTINAPWFNKYQDQRAPWRRFLYLWRSPEVQELARRHFEVGIDVLGSGWGSLLMLRAGIPYRLGVRGYAGGHSAVHAAVTFNPSEHVGRSALRFAELLGATQLPPCRPQLFLTAEEAAAGERWWAAAEGGSWRPRVVIGPGAGLAAKCWPAESFVALAAGLAATGDLTLLGLGSAREGDLVAAVALAAGGCGHAETPSLRTVFALVAASDIVVCNSSMLLHVAAAFGRPTVVLLGRAFPSASLHQAQWGYPGISQSLGREPGQREDVTTPAAALRIVREQLTKLAARSPRA